MSESFSHGRRGYEVHGCRCDVCRSANSEHGRQRMTGTEAREHQRATLRAQGRALRRLRRMHLADYKRLYAEEIRAIRLGDKP